MQPTRRDPNNHNNNNNDYNSNTQVNAGGNVAVQGGVVEKRLEAAKRMAVEATKADASGDTPKALRLYRDSLLELDSLLTDRDADTQALGSEEEAKEEVVSDAERHAILSIRSKYIQRVNQILATSPKNVASLFLKDATISLQPASSEQSKFSAPATNPPPSLFNSIYKHAIEAQPNDPTPDNKAKLPPKIPPKMAKPNQLVSHLRVLSTQLHIISTTTAPGAFVTPRLSVPAQVWVQPPGARLIAFENKRAALDVMLTFLSDKEKLKPSTSATISSNVIYLKEALDAVFMSPQSSALLKKLVGEIEGVAQFSPSMGNQIPSSGGVGGSGGWLSKMMGGAVSAVQTIPKGEKISDLQPYAESIGRLFRILAVAFDSWASVFTNHAQLASNTMLVQDVEYVVKAVEQVFLAFVVKDLDRLLTRYVGKVTAAAADLM